MEEKRVAWTVTHMSNKPLLVIIQAKEGHNAPVGTNYREKIQLPTLPSVYGAMLAGVTYVRDSPLSCASIPTHFRELSQTCSPQSSFQG